ncbi:MAG: tetratricopeptide repeat protein [Bacteroidia bacterium]
MFCKKITFYLSICFLFFVEQTPYAQNTDSLKNLLKIIKDDTNKIKTYNLLSSYYIDDGNYILALQCAEQANSLADKLSFKKGQIKSLINIGTINYHKGDYSQALANYFASLKLSEKTNNNKEIGNLYAFIGHVYDDMGNTTSTLEYYNKCLQIRIGLNDKKGIANLYSDIGIVYDYGGDYAQARKFYQQSLEIRKEIKDQDGLADSYTNLGIVYQEEGNYDEALNYNFKSLPIYESTRYTKGIVACYNNIGVNYYLKKNYALSKEYINKGLVLAKQIGSKSDIKEGYYGLTNLDSALGNYKAVYHNYKNFIIYRDSLINEESTKKILQEQFKYEAERKETIAKAEQDKKDTVAETDRKRQLLVLWLIGIAGAGVSIVALLIYRSLQQNKKAKKIIEAQKHEVELQQKEILDSITYAKHLQQAILPAEGHIKEYLLNFFIYYKPKDIVAGDFYWMEYLDNCVFIAAADSTGHGVPGAMVSIVCSNALNRAVKEFELRDTGKILDKTRELVLETFEKSGAEIKDGMDISLCKINKTNNLVQWSGANNPLWYIKNNGAEVLEIKANKQPIGQTDNPKPFTAHTLDLQKNDTLYLMTDGYPDQFGGEKGKKFKYKKLEDLLLLNTRKPLEEQKNILSTVFNAWKGNLEQVDDVTIIGIRL